MNDLVEFDDDDVGRGQGFEGVDEGTRISVRDK